MKNEIEIKIYHTINFPIPPNFSVCHYEDEEYLALYDCMEIYLKIILSPEIDVYYYNDNSLSLTYEDIVAIQVTDTLYYNKKYIEDEWERERIERENER